MVSRKRAADKRRASRVGNPVVDHSAGPSGLNEDLFVIDDAVLTTRARAISRHKALSDKAKSDAREGKFTSSRRKEKPLKPIIRKKEEAQEPLVYDVWGDSSVEQNQETPKKKAPTDERHDLDDDHSYNPTLAAHQRQLAVALDAEMTALELKEAAQQSYTPRSVGGVPNPQKNEEKEQSHDSEEEVQPAHTVTFTRANRRQQNEIRRRYREAREIECEKKVRRQIGQIDKLIQEMKEAEQERARKRLLREQRIRSMPRQDKREDFLLSDEITGNLRSTRVTDTSTVESLYSLISGRILKPVSRKKAHSS